jgi:hypothetical protein
MNETKSFSIRADLLGKVTVVVDRLNRRAAKLGVDSIVLTHTHPELREVKDPVTAKSFWYRMCEMTISLNIPKLADWSFVCTIQHSEAGNLLLTVPRGKDAPAIDLSAYRTCAPVCCHCNLERNRADTYLVQHLDGSLKQVGKNCLASFTGYGKSPEQAASMAEWLSSVATFFDDPAVDEEHDGMGGYGGTAQGVSLDRFLSFVVAVSKVHGFRTRKQAEAMMTSSTKDDALFNMEPPKNISVSKLIHPDDADMAFGKEARTWAAAIEPKSDFDHNLKVVASADGVLYRNLGIAAYLVEAFRKHLGIGAERLARPNSLHFGTEKERLRSLKLTYRGNYSFDSQYGTTFIHRFVTENGSDAIWKTGDSGGFREGDTITVDATVKKHGDYKGRLQTELSRVKVVVP